MVHSCDKWIYRYTLPKACIQQTNYLSSSTIYHKKDELISFRSFALKKKTVKLFLSKGRQDLWWDDCLIHNHVYRGIPVWKNAKSGTDCRSVNTSMISEE